MRKQQNASALLIAVSAFLAACSSGGHQGTATTSTTATTAVATTVAPGETSKLALIMSQAPPGYRYVDPPSSLTNEIQSVYENSPSLSKLVKGFSAHSVLRQSDNSTIGLVFLLQLDPALAAQPNAEEVVLEGIGATASDIHHVDLGGHTWSKGTIKIDSSSLIYASVQQDVLFAVAGDDAAAIESYLTAAQLTP